MSDNAKCYDQPPVPPPPWTELGVRHILTPPYTPRWNGKIERFFGTLEAEWAHGRVWPNSAQRDRALSSFLSYYNRQRPTAPPAADHPSPAFTKSAGRTADRSAKTGLRIGPLSRVAGEGLSLSVFDGGRLLLGPVAQRGAGCRRLVLAVDPGKAFNRVWLTTRASGG